MSILQKEMTHTPKLYSGVFLAPFVSKLGKSIAGECEQLLANRGKSAEVCVPQSMLGALTQKCVPPHSPFGCGNLARASLCVNSCRWANEKHSD